MMTRGLHVRICKAERSKTGVVQPEAIDFIQNGAYTVETKCCRTFQRKPTECASFHDGRFAGEEVRVNNT
jgi:hypothetical protein